MKNDTKHTPGPWRLDNPSDNSAINDADGYRCIAAANGFIDSDGHGFTLTGYISMPDAMLMRAAPELLAALQTIQAEFENARQMISEPELFSPSDTKDYDPRFERAKSVARAAIQAATGGSGT